MVKNPFEKSTVPECHSVNYIWLCPKERGTERSATRLPLHYFERTYKNAKKYQNITFNLWFDFEQLRAADRFFLDSHRYLFDAPKIKICNLREIFEYSESPGFDPDSNIALYARADYARILVLKHLLSGEHNDIIIYSDLDCEDIKINDSSVRKTIETFGIVFGHSGASNVCNGYIALQGEGGRCFMKEFLLPETQKAFQKNLVNHFGAFSKAIKGFVKKYYPDLSRSHLGEVELPLMRRRMPYNEDMYEGVCATKEARVPGSKELV